MKRSAVPLLLASSLLGPSLPGVTVFTWIGGGGDGNWSTAANWSTAFDNADGGDWDELVFTGTSQLASNNDTGGAFGGRNVDSITFDASAGAFVLTDNGDGFDMLGADAAASPDGDATITNNSTATQTIDIDLLHRSDFNTGLVFNATAGDIVVSGDILNQGGSTDDVDIFGPNTVLFSGTNTFQDPVRIHSGTLQLQGGNTIDDGGYVAPQNAGAALEFLSDEVIGAFDGPAGSTVQLNGNTVTTGSRSGNRSFGGALLGTTASELIKVGTQEIRFITASDLSGFSGTMDVTAGQVRIDAEAGDLSAFGNMDAEIIVRSGAILLGVSSNTATYDVGQITLDGGNLKGAGANHNRFKLVDITANGGTIGRTESFDSQVRLEGLSGTGDLTVQGPAGGNRNYWVVLENTVNQALFTGDYIIDAGRLVSSGSELMNDMSRVNVINGGEWNLRGTETIGSLAGDSTAQIGRGFGTGNIHLITGNDNTNATFAGVISNDGNAATTATNLEFTKIGTGTQTLTGANTYTGDTNVDGGILAITSGGSVIGTSNLNVGIGGELYLADGDLTTASGGLFALDGILRLDSAGDISVGDTTWNGSIIDQTVMGDATFTEGDGTLLSTGTSILDLTTAGNVFDLVGALDLSAGGTLNGFDTLGVPFAGMSNAITQNIYELKLVDTTGGVFGAFSTTNFAGSSVVPAGLANLAQQGDYFLEIRSGDELWIVTRVPEPSRALLLLAGAGLLMLRRQR